MTDHIWVGGAPTVAQVVTVTLPSDIETGQVFTATINNKELSYTFPDGPLRTDVAAAIVSAWNLSDIAEFDEITAADNGDGSFTLTADTAGIPFVVTTKIGTGTNEKQVVTLGNSPSGGTFTLTYDGQTTGNIAYDASASTVDTALEALSNIGAGDVTVTGSAGGPWTVEFTGSLAATDVALMTGDATNLTGTNEQQIVTLHTATGGTFTLTYGGQTTSGIAYNAAAATVQSALEALSSIGSSNVSVTGSAGGPWTVEFTGTLATTDVALMTLDGANLTGGLSASIAETTPGGGGSNERHIIQAHQTDDSDTNGIFKINGDASASGGTWDLTVNNGSQDFITLTDIPWDVTVAELQALVDAEAASWGTDYAYRVFIAHHLLLSPAGNEKFSDGTDVYVFIDAALGLSTFTATVDSTNLTGGTFTDGYVDGPLTGNYGDYGEGSGSWRFLIDGDATDDLSPTISAADLQAAIEGMAAVGAGNVAVYAMNTAADNGFTNGGGFVIEFQGDLANQANGFTITTSKSASSALNLEVFTGYTGGGGTSEVQTLSISGSPSSGVFGLRYDGYSTGALDYNATAAEVETALEGLTSIGTGKVSCSGGDLPGSDVVITFAGGLSGLDLDAITIDGGYVTESVAGGNDPTVTIATTQSPVTQTTTTANSGPNCWDVASNWDTNTVPVNSDNVYIIDGENIEYGLDQSAVTLGRLQIHNKELQIGLPRRNDDYWEYRDTFLKIGASTIVVGVGDGNGSDRIQIDFGSTDPAIEVYGSGAGDDEPAIQFNALNSTNTATLTLIEGEVGVAIYPKDAAYFSKITQRGGILTLGTDVTIAELDKTGGDLSSYRTTIGGTTTL